MSKSEKATPLLKLAIGISLLSLIGVLGLYWTQSSSEKKLAFIRTDELLTKYQGMVEAKAAYQSKAANWQAKIDTLKTEFEQALKKYESSQGKMNSSEREKTENALRKQQSDLARYTESISKDAEQEDKKMTEGVLNQVNIFLEQYGKNHNYDIIFGANGTGNIIYGGDSKDITNEVLIELNNDFYGR